MAYDVFDIQTGGQAVEVFLRLFFLCPFVSVFDALFGFEICEIHAVS
jgi:hypothetical protein